MSRGRFITFEGGEGAGKSTQARLLAEDLRRRGLGVLLTREPGGTPGAEAIRQLLLEPPGDGWTAASEALLFAAARADHIARAIRPALNRGGWVICDRFVDSSRAYQGGAGGIGDDAVQALHRIGSAGLLPDLTILIEIGSGAAQQRLRRRDGNTADAIGGRDASYHREVARAFERLALAEPERFVRIDGGEEMDAVHAEIVRAVERLL